MTALGFLVGKCRSCTGATENIKGSEDMTKKNERFAIEYLVDANATQAAIRAGYSEKTAYSQGQRLLKNVEVQNYIQEHMKAIEDARIATADEVIKYLTSVLRGESEGEEIVVEGCGDGVSEARVIMKAPSEKDKLKAAELLGKRYGLFKDNVSLEVEPIVINNDLTE
jgi:phage terminase small subunit